MYDLCPVCGSELDDEGNCWVCGYMAHFGSPDDLISNPPRFAVEVCVKEVMNISRHFFLSNLKSKRRN